MNKRHVCHITGRRTRQHSRALWNAAMESEQFSGLTGFEHLILSGESETALIAYENHEPGEHRMMVVSVDIA